VILNRPTRPVVLREGIGGNLDLPGDIVDDRRRQLSRMGREPRLEIKETEQQREPQPGRAGLV